MVAVIEALRVMAELVGIESKAQFYWTIYSIPCWFRLLHIQKKKIRLCRSGRTKSLPFLFQNLNSYHCTYIYLVVYGITYDLRRRLKEKLFHISKKALENEFELLYPSVL